MSATNGTNGKLQGKVAIVTGASKGIGAAIAKELGAQGASVVVNYASSREGGEKVAGEIVQAGGKAVAVGADMSKPEEIKALFAAAKKEYGKLDVLVNNAGIYNFAPLADVTVESFHKHFNINVLGLLLASQEAAAAFGDAGGSIINISSVVSTNGYAGNVVYNSTKGAVDTITRTLANELGPKKIRVNAINPGPVLTEGAAAIFTGEIEKMMIAQTPLGRIGLPEDYGPVAVFLASEDSRWITGQTILVAGGLR